MTHQSASGIRDKREGIDDDDILIISKEFYEANTRSVTKLNESDPQGAIRAAAQNQFLLFAFYCGYLLTPIGRIWINLIVVLAKSSSSTLSSQLSNIIVIPEMHCCKNLTQKNPSIVIVIRL